MHELAGPVLTGDIRALARAATLIENHMHRAAELLRDLSGYTGRAFILGLTGAPGTGKSTLCDQLIRHFRLEGKTVGVIAIDPSSPVTGGAVLGDRVRMQRHHADPGVYIRSMAARGMPGGLASAAASLATVLDAAGREVIIIETVGVGQSEVDIAGLAHVVVLVLAPGAGDSVQAMKAGVMEVASLFVVNKADLAGADKLKNDLESEADGRKVLLTVASEDRGIDSLIEALRESRKPVELPVKAREARIDHIGIAVRSLDAALGFYEQQLGLRVSMRDHVAEEKVNAAMLPLGGPRIELLEASDPESVIAKFIGKRGEGLHHIALRVPDLSDTVGRLKLSGARILNEPRSGAGGHLYVFIHPSSTGGVLLELIQE